MNKEEVFKKVLEVYEDVFSDDEQYDIGTEFKDIDSWDSMDNVLFLSKLESKFNIKFKTGDMVSIKTFEDIVNCIIEKL